MVKESDFLISNQEILGGLKAAIERGESLKDAMMTFYQAGYDKFEIEEAARAYMNQAKGETDIQAGMRNVVPAKAPEKKEEPKKEEPKKEIKKLPSASILPKPEPNPSTSAEQKKNKAPQVVSKYEAPKKPKPPKSNTLTIFLVLTLLFLLGILAAVFLFKEELIDFINNLFG